MPKSHRYATLLVIVALAAFLALGCDRVAQSPTDTRPPTHPNDATDFEPKVVLFVIDGARYTETIGDPLHSYVPHLWNDLGPHGTFLTNFRNRGYTSTVPGHCSILTGTWQYLANDGSERPDKPTIFEYYRRDTAAPQTQAWVISGKAKLDVCAYSTHPDYGAAYGATASVGHTSDVAVYNELISVLENHKPRLVLVCLPDVDLAGHSGVWADYLAAIVGADSLAWKTWEYLESDPFYAGQTYMFVTNDHGRHDDQHGGFRNHGDDCEGCQHLMFLALGPNIQAGHTSDAPFSQRHVCKTVGEVLGFSTPLADAGEIPDIFEQVPVGIHR
jgi:hypothetical protein